MHQDHVRHLLSSPKQLSSYTRDLVAWIMPEGSIFNGLDDAANSKELNIINKLAYLCNNAARALT